MRVEPVAFSVFCFLDGGAPVLLPADPPPLGEEDLGDVEFPPGAMPVRMSAYAVTTGFDASNKGVVLSGHVCLVTWDK